MQLSLLVPVLKIFDKLLKFNPPRRFSAGSKKVSGNDTCSYALPQLRDQPGQFRW
jgi:hypothetical protein